MLVKIQIPPSQPMNILGLFFRALKKPDLGPLLGLLLLVILGHSKLVLAQTQAYALNEDKVASFYRLAVLDLRDNTQGAFATQLHVKLLQHLENLNQLQFDAYSWPSFANESPIERKKWMEQKGVDGVITSEIVRTQNIYRLKISLFDRHGQLFLEQERAPEYDLDFERASKILKDLSHNLIASLPYHGWVLSRHENLVTINMGRRQNVKANEILGVYFISNIQRHPQFQFATQFEKFVIGKIKVQKVEADLSFGSIIEERTPGLIQKFMKLQNNEMQHYPALIKDETASLKSLRLNSNEAPLVVGQDPQLWDQAYPQFGFVQFQGGLGLASYSDTLASGQSSFVPSVATQAEIWMTPVLTLEVAAAQSMGTLAVQNSSAGDSSQNLSARDFHIGSHYKFFFDEDKSQSYIGLGAHYFFSDLQWPSDATMLSGLNFSIKMRLALPDQKTAVLGYLETPLIGVTGRQRFGVMGEFFISPFKAWTLSLDLISYDSQNSRSARLGLSRLNAGLIYYF